MYAKAMDILRSETRILLSCVYIGKNERNRQVGLELLMNMDRISTYNLISKAV